MNYRFMRLVLFFDLPVKTAKQRKSYRHFVKDLKTLGFYSIQYSVFVKMSMDQRAAEAAVLDVKKVLPSEGHVAVLTITEKQFSSIEYLLGEKETDVINSQDKVVEL